MHTLVVLIHLNRIHSAKYRVANNVLASNLKTPMTPMKACSSLFDLRWWFSVDAGLKFCAAISTTLLGLIGCDFDVFRESLFVVSGRNSMFVRVVADDDSKFGVERDDVSIWDSVEI